MRLAISAVLVVLMSQAALPFIVGANELAAQEKAKPQPGWSLDEAMAQLRLYPKDPYLQYVALQLARRENRVNEIAPQIERLTGARVSQQAPGAERIERVDLFNIFSGALAVQECLQLDTMRGNGQPRPGPGRPAAGRFWPGWQLIKIGDLTGPTIQSHPWEKMLGDKKPVVSALARCVPEDFYFAESRTFNALLDALAINDLWGTHLFTQGVQEARKQNLPERLMAQLAIEAGSPLHSFYDRAVAEVAITGSDPYLWEGSDITFVFRVKQPDVFKSQMDDFLARSEKSHPGARRTNGEYRGVAFTQLGTSDRSVHVFSAYVSPELHVRSNSRVAVERVLDAIQGKHASGEPIRTLGSTAEFAYIRTLLPQGAKEEDVLVYLSDPFIRRAIGPQVKLTERRRLYCQNHLRMIGHGALLYHTERGKPPTSLEELAKAGCAPGVFGEDTLTCPDGGKYRLAEDGVTGVCSHHGRAHALTPGCEIALKEVYGSEAEDYDKFLQDYNRQWRTYFDPIALRIQLTPKKYRIETLVLPLIDNSIYANLARTLGGKPEPLDALPVPKRNIFSLAVRFNKEELLRQVGLELVTKPERPTAKEGSADHLRIDMARSADNLRKIARAMHDYQYRRDFRDSRLPGPVIYDKGETRPLLSWRVALLPYLEQEELYKEFKLDEPWDSEHNKKLISRMPVIYELPGRKAIPEGAGKTSYLVPVGDKTIFRRDPKWRARIGDSSVIDGLNDTILVVEADADRAVIWTKPDDLDVDLNNPMNGLGANHPQGTLVVLGDTSTRCLLKAIDVKTVAAFFTYDVRDSVSYDRVLLISPTVLPLDEIERLKLGPLLSKGLGNQIGLHAYDVAPLFEFNAPAFLGLAMGEFSRQPPGTGELAWTVIFGSFLITSLNAPAYLSIPVEDPNIVDEFLTRLDDRLAMLAREKGMDGAFGVEFDFYRFPLAGNTHIRCYNIRFGPLKWRLFWGRIGRGLYVASKPFIIEDLLAIEAGQAQAANAGADPGPEAHALVRVRPRNWNQVLPDYRLGWAENNRQACLHNLGPLASLARALPAKRDGAALPDGLQALIPTIYGAKFFCPEEGAFELSPDGKTVTCSVHGSAQQPRQSIAPSASSALGKLVRDFDGLTVSLTFQEDGLRSVVSIERK